MYICKEEILQEALKSISLEICESKTCVIGDGEIGGSICIDAPSHGPYSMLHRKKIFDDWKSTEEDALESARLAALLYLQKTGLIFVDDINQNELTKCEAKLLDCRRKLLAASNWANMFQEETEALKMKLAVAYEENEKMVEKNKAYGMKEEAADPQADAVDIKEEAAYRCSRYEKQPNLTTVPVKRPLFKGQAVSVHGLQHTALARDQQKSCTDVEALAPLDTYGDLLVLEDAVKKEFPDVLPSLLS